MFRPMRRNRQELSSAACTAILERATAGVLAVAGDEGYPYAVPLSFVYHENKIYFHCATSGHKLDAITRCDKVSFCVIGQDQVMPQEYTTYFQSVIAFGRARILTDPAEAQAAITLLAQKYAPDDTAAAREAAIAQAGPALCMVEIQVEHLSGKEARELMAARTKTPQA